MKQCLSSPLQRQMGLKAATVLVVANMVGTGVFTTSGFILGELGSSQALMLAWLLGALFALAGALCYGELGAMLPHAGGEYAYLRRSFGPMPAFVSGWISLIVGFSAPIAAAAIAFATYFLGGDREAWLAWGWGGRTWFSLSPVSLLAMAAVVVFSLVHYHSLRLGQRVQNGLTLFKVIFIVGFMLTGFLWGQGDGDRLLGAITGAGQAAPEGGAFAVALIFVSFAYSGWNAAAYLGGEILRPERNLPLALVLGTACVSLLYLGLNLLYVYALPPQVMGGMLEVGSGAAAALFGPGAATLVGMAISLGLLSVVSAMIMAGPRVYYAMASHGLFFRRFGQVDGTRHTPAQAILFQALIAILMILTAAFDTLLVYIGFTLSLSAMLTVLGMMRLRRLEPDLPRPYRTLAYPWVPLFFIFGNLWIVLYSLFSRPLVAIFGGLTLGAGWLLYFWFRQPLPKPCGDAC